MYLLWYRAYYIIIEYVHLLVYLDYKYTFHCLPEFKNSNDIMPYRNDDLVFVVTTICKLTMFKWGRIRALDQQYQPVQHEESVHDRMWPVVDLVEYYVFGQFEIGPMVYHLF